MEPEYEKDANTAIYDADLHETTNVSAEDLLKIMEELSEHPFSYDAHVKYISALRSMGQSEDLRAARESMYSIFPLTEAQWLEWIEDEKSVASSVDDKVRILDIYSRAVKDYLSIPLWVGYVQYATQGAIPDSEEEEEDENENGVSKTQEPWMPIDKARSVCEQAKTATELHIPESHKVWNIYRDFELRILEATPEDASQIDRVRNMFLSRLQVPHSNMSDTFDSYSPFETSFDIANYEVKMKAANKIRSKTEGILKHREVFERKLAQSSNSLSSFIDYIESERQARSVDKMFVRSLFERAITIHCLDPTLWEMYLAFLMNDFKIGSLVTTVADRAVRNCNWSGDLWGHRIRIGEAFSETESSLKVKSLDQFISLMKHECSRVRRKVLADPSSFAELRYAYEEARTILKEKCGEDPLFRLERLQIQDETYISRDLAQAREIYQTLLKSNTQDSSIYVDAADFERIHCQDISKARTILKQGCFKRLDWPERVFESWLAFESDYGDSATYYEAFGKIKAQAKFVEKRRLKESMYNGSTTQSITTENVAVEPSQSEPVEASKAKRRRETDHNDEAEAEKPKKKGKKVIRAKDDAEAMDREGEAMEAEPMEVEKTKAAKPRDFYVIENSNAGNMVHLAGLPADCAVDHLKTLFGAKKKLVDYYIDVSDDGIRHGFIEFPKAEQAAAAAAKETIDILGTSVDVQRCIPAQSKWSDFDEKSEPTKIYISNIDILADKPLLRSEFGKFGKIKEVRLVLRKTIAFAYIEYEIAKSAEKAVEIMNGKTLEGFPGRKLTVAISDRNQTKEKVQDKRELFVSNFALSTKEEALRELFEQHGAVKEIRMIMTRDGLPKGIAFVEFESEESAKSALAVNGTLLDGRVLSVSPTDPNVRGGVRKQSESNRGGSYAGRGGRGGFSERGGRGGFGGGKPGLGYSGKHRYEAVASSSQTPNARAPAVTATTTSLKPRARMTAAPRQAPKKHFGTITPISQASQTGDKADSNSGSSTGKTQDDFRKLMMGGSKSFQEVIDLTEQDEDITVKKPGSHISGPKGNVSTSSSSSSSSSSSNATPTKYLHSGIKLIRIDPAEKDDNVDTVSLSDLLRLDGDLELMYQFNYMLELEWFLGHLPSHLVPTVKMHFVIHPEPGLKEFTFPYVEQYGTHHTKMMILFFKNGAARVVIHTANLIQRDWGKKSQGAWISSKLQKQSQTQQQGPNRQFKPDLLKYLEPYGPPLNELRRRLEEYDFTHEKAQIVGSIPGRHQQSKGSLKLWGHMRLNDILKKNVDLSETCRASSSLIAQFSSVGSLGKDDKWLVEEFGRSLWESRNGRTLSSSPNLKLVFPTYAQVRDSNQGWSAGNSIPFSNENWMKQKSYMQRMLHSWIAEKAGRAPAMPHIKTFCRLNESTGEICWMYLGSHNLSKAAWGTLQIKNTQLFIRSYELGVIVHPDLFKSLKFDDENSGNVKSSSNSKAVVVVRLPYDLELQKYEKDDEPWRWDVKFPGFDSHGEERDV
ncbi:tyrosyl-DNA phosphodiesterase 1 [Blyttiomyces sp. JEL0837]|nr:tyrosyl-DNA phosphodiesterase 1 [Blyttiomyces sp. JEL0837]